MPIAAGWTALTEVLAVCAGCVRELAFTTNRAHRSTHRVRVLALTAEGANGRRWCAGVLACFAITAL
jgi:hypothetical protein